MTAKQAAATSQRCRLPDATKPSSPQPPELARRSAHGEYALPLRATLRPWPVVAQGNLCRHATLHNRFANRLRGIAGAVDRLRRRADLRDRRPVDELERGFGEVVLRHRSLRLRKSPAKCRRPTTSCAFACRSGFGAAVCSRTCCIEEVSAADSCSLRELLRMERLRDEVDAAARRAARRTRCSAAARCRSRGPRARSASRRRRGGRRRDRRGKRHRRHRGRRCRDGCRRRRCRRLAAAAAREHGDNRKYERGPRHATSLVLANGPGSRKFGVVRGRLLVGLLVLAALAAGCSSSSKKKTTTSEAGRAGGALDRLEAAAGPGTPGRRAALPRCRSRGKSAGHVRAPLPGRHRAADDSEHEQPRLPADRHASGPFREARRPEAGADGDSADDLELSRGRLPAVEPSWRCGPASRPALTITWENWCDLLVPGKPHLPPSALRITLPGGRGSVDTDYNAVPECVDPTRPSTIGVSPFQPNLVRLRPHPWTSAFIRAAIPGQPLRARRGGILHFRVVLTNTSKSPRGLLALPGVRPAARAEQRGPRCTT